MNCVTPSIFPRPTVYLIVSVLALKSIAFHLIPITSSRLNPYTPAIITGSSIGVVFIISIRFNNSSCV